MKKTLKIIGPFKQILSLAHLPRIGSIRDAQLAVDVNSAVVVEQDKIIDIGKYDSLRNTWKNAQVEEINISMVLLPGFIDAHTHICYAGSRANDFAKRIAGVTYQEISKAGGGIWQTVSDTRKASVTELERLTADRVAHKVVQGITTVEIKSGYGLNFESEKKILQCIKSVANRSVIDIVPTCLAAHILPHDFKGNAPEYLSWIIHELLPYIKKNTLANRVDIFIEKGAFSTAEGQMFLQQAKKLEFELIVHADQFTSGGSKVAAAMKALSADHLEASTSEDIRRLIQAKVICTALPGASIGLGGNFAPARMILDHGGCLAIASDHNPGSAPQGDLLTQASILATYEKLTSAEVFAGMTFRAAAALNMTDRGRIAPGLKADFIGFSTNDFREILYHQGSLKPFFVWKNGLRVIDHSKSNIHASMA